MQNCIISKVIRYSDNFRNSIYRITCSNLHSYLFAEKYVKYNGDIFTYIGSVQKVSQKINMNQYLNVHHKSKLRILSEYVTIFFRIQFFINDIILLIPTFRTYVLTKKILLERQDHKNTINKTRLRYSSSIELVQSHCSLYNKPEL